VSEGLRPDCFAAPRADERELAPISATIVCAGDRRWQGSMMDAEFVGDGIGLVGRVVDQMLTAGMKLEDGLVTIKRGLIVEALERNDGNLCRASQQLGRHRNTIARELERLQLSELPAQIRKARQHAAQRTLPFKKFKQDAGRRNRARRGELTVISAAPRSIA
jgi:hypothetical protein